MSEFFYRGIISKDLGADSITLIPKKSGAFALNDFCPISLIGGPYKILDKILANRLKRVLLYIISLVQSAFLEGRQIVDLVVVAHECLILNFHQGMRVWCVN